MFPPSESNHALGLATVKASRLSPEKTMPLHSCADACNSPSPRSVSIICLAHYCYFVLESDDFCILGMDIR